MASLIVRFIRSTWPFVHGCFGFVSLWSTSLVAQAYSKACARKSFSSAIISLISTGDQELPVGSVKWVPLSVRTVWTL